MSKYAPAVERGHASGRACASLSRHTLSRPCYSVEQLSLPDGGRSWERALKLKARGLPTNVLLAQHFCPHVLSKLKRHRSSPATGRRLARSTNDALGGFVARAGTNDRRRRAVPQAPSPHVQQGNAHRGFARVGLSASPAYQPVMLVIVGPCRSGKTWLLGHLMGNIIMGPAYHSPARRRKPCVAGQGGEARGIVGHGGPRTKASGPAAAGFVWENLSLDKAVGAARGGFVVGGSRMTTNLTNLLFPQHFFPHVLSKQE